MSSYGASCSTCFPAASFAFATSVSSPIASARRFFHSVSVYFSNQHGHKHESLRRPRPPLSCSASVLSAAESCVLSSGFPPRNFSSDLRPIPVGAQHESTSPASNLPRAPARTVPVCFLFLRTRSRPSAQALRFTTPQRFCLRIPIDVAGLRPHCHPRSRSQPAQAHTNPIAPRAASFKSLYLKRPQTAPAGTALRSWALQIQPYDFRGVLGCPLLRNGRFPST